ncbi:hypothetical protein C7M61_001579 [Candidozyma pseudohaemuli]|uniref:Uncharacterized protein n=1 Tax=Candidozyma pseudohaemuli TaxID=418784 RepID=A0A2P7YUX9_9ASCO|nr:hypothetical protein C7M61_001579 [[Candida] pseudohaemulonii]PSK39774.1 hypothetical protein C7M61_001579 [[Candida] pseudohaemulonii]
MIKAPRNYKSLVPTTNVAMSNIIESIIGGIIDFMPPLWLILCIVVICVVILRISLFAEMIRSMRNHLRYLHSIRYRSLFQDDLENGLSSNNFDLTGNLEGDTREGLDENATTEIRNMMTMENISFDEARLRYFRDRLSNHGIGSDGVPTDRRTVTFDNI